MVFGCLSGYVSFDPCFAGIVGLGIGAFNHEILNPCMGDTGAVARQKSAKLLQSRSPRLSQSSPATDSSGTASKSNSKWMHVVALTLEEHVDAVAKSSAASESLLRDKKIELELCSRQLQDKLLAHERNLAAQGEAASHVQALVKVLDDRLRRMETLESEQARELSDVSKKLDIRIRTMEAEAEKQADLQATATRQASAKGELESIGVETLQRLEKRSIELDKWSKELQDKLLAQEQKSRQMSRQVSEAEEQAASDVKALAEKLDGRIRRMEAQAVQSKADGPPIRQGLENFESRETETFQHLEKMRIELDKDTKRLMSRLLSHAARKKNGAVDSGNNGSTAESEALQQTRSECETLREALKSTVSKKEYQALGAKVELLEKQVLVHKQERDEQRQANATLQQQAAQAEMVKKEALSSTVSMKEYQALVAKAALLEKQAFDSTIAKKDTVSMQEYQALAAKAGQLEKQVLNSTVSNKDTVSMKEYQALAAKAELLEKQALNSTVSNKEYQALGAKAEQLEKQVLVHRQEIDEQRQANATLQQQAAQAEMLEKQVLVHRQEIEQQRQANATLQQQAAQAEMLEKQVLVHRQEIDEQRQANATLQKQLEIYTARAAEVQLPSSPPRNPAGYGNAPIVPSLSAPTSPAVEAPAVDPRSFRPLAVEAPAVDTSLDIVLERKAAGPPPQPSEESRQVASKIQRRIAEMSSPPVVWKQLSSPEQMQLSAAPPAKPQPVASGGVSSAYPRAGPFRGSDQNKLQTPSLRPSTSSSSVPVAKQGFSKAPVPRSSSPLQGPSTLPGPLAGAKLQGSVYPRMAASANGSGAAVTSPSSSPPGSATLPVAGAKLQGSVYPRMAASANSSGTAVSSSSAAPRRRLVQPNTRSI